MFVDSALKLLRRLSGHHVPPGEFKYNDRVVIVWPGTDLNKKTASVVYADDSLSKVAYVLRLDERGPDGDIYRTVYATQLRPEGGAE